MSLTLKLVKTDNAILKDLQKALAKDVNVKIQKNKKKIEQHIKSAITRWIAEQPEIIDLINDGVPGSLNAQLGFPTGTAAGAINAIIDAVVQTVEVLITPIKSNLQGGLEFRIQPSSFSGLLGLPAGFIISEGGVQLHWLDWLLNQGSNVIITGYNYVPSSDGRSGGGTMEIGSMWRIPPQFSGTPSDNFISRALSKRDKELTKILSGLFV